MPAGLGGQMSERPSERGSEPKPKLRRTAGWATTQPRQSDRSGSGGGAVHWTIARKNKEDFIYCKTCI